MITHDPNGPYDVQDFLAMAEPKCIYCGDKAFADGEDCTGCWEVRHRIEDFLKHKANRDFVRLELQKHEVPVVYNLAEIEKRSIYACLSKHKGNKADAAHELGIALKTLYNKLNAYELKT